MIFSERNRNKHRAICPPQKSCGRQTLLSALLLVCLAVRPATATDIGPETPPKESPGQVMRLVTILDRDDQGKTLRFPVNITTEKDTGEIYVINGGRGNILIYGPDFFPHLVLGAGRDIGNPQCLFFDPRKGRVLIGQNNSADKPSRLTILNGAFLPEKEITFAGMPGAENFSVINGKVGINGNIYLLGNQSRGALVLDSQGNFSHWLRPVDKLYRDDIEIPASSRERRDRLSRMQEGQKEEPPETAAPDSSAAPPGLPAELRPKSGRAIPRDQEKDKGLQPVLLRDLAIDSDGRIFLLSEETSKVYVYGPGENFLFSFGQKGGSSGKMSRPRGIALDEQKKCIYIVDYMRHTILIFDMAGRLIFEFGGRGTGPLWFNFPTAVAVDRQGRLLVADLFNNRIQILESDFSVSYPVFGGTKGMPSKKEAAPPEKSTDNR
ncbi:MAG: hypothetical protein C0613_02250 [Desulfobulbaceae bacterium]|nr:MAG: hypothetical protein C0613_02250 [Desulfobulbaceae bacterium]